jgi:hypothetical protein
MSTLSSSNNNNNNGRYYNDANHPLDHNDDDYEPSTSYYMVQDSCQSLDEKYITNTLENESKLSTILQSNHTNESHCQHLEQQQPHEEETTISSYRNKITYILNQMKHIYRKETLLVEVLIVIMLAKIYPRIGTDFVFPEITAHWIAVMTIFCKWKERGP